MAIESAEISIFDRLSRRQVPVLPPGASYLLKALTDENIEFSALAQIIERFPTIAGRLIALANSAWSSPVHTITALDRACSRLGFSVVRSTSIALAVASPFDPSRCPGFNTESFWTRALMTADAASWLAPVASSVDGLESSAARTAGLLHSLGLLWLTDQLPDEVDQAYTIVEENDFVSLSQALSGLIGFDDVYAGGYLGGAWHLPEQLVTAMAHYPESDFQGGYWETATLVGVAVSLVTAAQQETPWSATDSRLERLGITVTAVEKVVQQINRQFERTQELAKTLFNG
ncbi:MAG: HDOD domain-containing protein [gamma proteobacterium endosymbiont of Lamellibrachia anaximandri]|nr:HDOD domain-containing protein [gamma proteobacterium endosymbiont of Lamellibrachia anaximandri]MBL3616660.1 HDOD domain-containing protein [gamma proteobacterium endosymbiont of Lamellibrachia anaximandri]